MPTKDKRLPLGATLLAQDSDGRVYQTGDALVLERTFAGKRVETRLPLDLEWLWSWNELMTQACDRAATLADR